MSNVIVVVILIGAIGAAVYYMVREKKKGVKCIGCPAGENCAMKYKKHPEHEKHKCRCHSEK